MYKILNILMIFLILSFIFIIFKYYSSNLNISNRFYNRINIDKILKDKVKDLPVLKNDTDNVIFFNDSFENRVNEDKKRSFWDLLNKK